MKDVAIGIDIGGTYSKLGIVDNFGNCLKESSISTKDHLKFESFFDAVIAEIDHLRKPLKDLIEIKGIGIGAPNANYYTGTIENAPNLNWKGTVHIADKFREYYELPVVVTNDANAAAVGEKIYGAAKDLNDFLVITLGTGLGSGFVANGQLIYGHQGFAGEMGHIIVERNGRHGTAGLKGTLESYVSATGMKRTIFQLMADMLDDSPLRDIPFTHMTSKKIYEAAIKGDKLALAAFELTGRYLGEALAIAVAHTNPEAIFLFGGLAKAGDLIINPTKKHMEENLLHIYKGKVKILPSGLEDANAAVLGASALVWDQILKSSI